MAARQDIPDCTIKCQALTPELLVDVGFKGINGYFVYVVPNALLVGSTKQWIDNLASDPTVEDFFAQEYDENIKKWIVLAVTVGENVAKIGALYQKAVTASAENQNSYSPLFSLINLDKYSWYRAETWPKMKSLASAINWP